MRAWDVEEIWCTLLLVLLSMGGYVPVAMSGLNAAGSRFQYDTAASSPISRAVIALMWLGVLLPVARLFPRLLNHAYAIRPLLPYILFALASMAWSQDAGISFRKLASLLLTCIFGLYFAVRFPVERQMKLIFRATFLLAITSTALVLVAPHAAVDHNQHAGAWQGVFAGKNACAMVMVIGLASAIVQRPVGILSIATKIVSMALFALVIYMAESSGALVVIALLWISLPMLRYLARYQRKARALLSAFLLIGGVACAICTIEYLPLILKLLNRDPTLTGRTDIWKAVLQSIFKHPLLGYGYGAFWLGLKGESSNVVLALKWAIPNAHNGFLDIWLSLGAVGLGLFVYAMFAALQRIWKLILADELTQNVWLIASVLLVMTYNLDESVLISTPSLMWTLLVSAICGLELLARSQHTKVAAANDHRRLSLAATGLLPA